MYQQNHSGVGRAIMNMHLLPTQACLKNVNLKSRALYPLQKLSLLQVCFVRKGFAMGADSQGVT